MGDHIISTTNSLTAIDFFSARAYFLSESYDRAEAVLDELLPAIDAGKDQVRLSSATVLLRERDIDDLLQGELRISRASVAEIGRVEKEKNRRSGSAEW